MELRELPAESAAVRRYVEELWLPYHRDLAANVEEHDLDTDGDRATDLVEAEVEFRTDWLAEDSQDLWLALDDVPPDCADAVDGFVRGDAEVAGFVGTALDEAPLVFDRPDRLLVTDVYVREPYRGTGLARELFAFAAERARERDCPELTLEVGVDNERAIAFYEKLGFEPHRRQLTVDASRLPDRRADAPDEEE